ncbi:MpV17 mitochondrial inner membrane protein [Puccinia graminis f. sp. tritici]|uniref:MpV17 mitochondrial inner membrane protein n=1 Tax=Puccinia graminis f. sp. tritici TaxID=56615 RepID=A0A5B0PH01_PUCGR|nr:MpV17 mitochondrial inner membrane protein [Puccinia graminis f. sp. tritici]
MRSHNISSTKNHGRTITNKTLNRITYPTSKLKTVLCRVGIDMALFTSFATCYFFTCMGFLEGRTWHEIKARIERNYSTVVWTNIGIFGPAQIINMRSVDRQTYHARIKYGPSNTHTPTPPIFSPQKLENSLVPVYGRPPFLNLVSLGYNCFLATVNNNTPSVIPTVSAEKLVIANTT